MAAAKDKAAKKEEAKRAEAEKHRKKRIAELKALVAEYENLLHEAKKTLDWHKYNWLGLHIDIVRENRRLFRVRTPELERVAKAYREIQRIYWMLKNRLDMLDWKESVKGGVAEARKKMVAKYAPTFRHFANLAILLDDFVFNPEEEVELMTEIGKDIAKAVEAMHRNPSERSVLVVVETLAAAEETGYDHYDAADAKSTLDAARRVAEKLVLEGREKWDLERPEAKRRLLGRMILYTSLGGAVHNLDFATRD